MARAAAKTGSGPTAMVALEQNFPKSERILTDDLNLESVILNAAKRRILEDAPCAVYA